MDETDIHGTFNTGATLGPVNETNMARIWNKHKQIHPIRKRVASNGAGTPLKPHTSSLRGKRKVFVAMSGGVDSSVAAALLKERGFDVVGIHMKCFNVDGCAANDAEDARRAAEFLNIPFYTFDFEQEYKDKVVKYMVAGYKKGITPNPDVMCNKEIKFGLFYKKAMELGADFIATGHYIRKVISKSQLPITNYQLRIAKDRNKDQSYFLWTIKPEQLEKCIFPIGDYTKPQVRKLAAKFGLHNALKKDSQGICFLGQVALPDFLKKYIKPKKGDILLAPPVIVRASSSLSLRGAKRRGNLTLKPVKIGIHNGARSYTIGQRHGLGVGGFAKPLYVVAKDVKKNTITVAEGDDHPALYKKEVELANVNWLFPEPRRGTTSVLARVRYRQPLQKATIQLSNSRELENRGKFVLRFVKPVKFVASGQSAVFYNAKGVMLGGGIIQG